MNKLEIMNKFNRTFSKVSLQLKKHSPELLVGAGVVGVVASTVMACKATTKVSEVLDKTKNDIDDIHYCLENPDEIKEEYTVEDSKKDLAVIYTQTGVELVKLYGPAVVVGTVSIASILTGHNILRKRNLALASAYAIVDKGFKEYRGRVIERFGKELDRELKYNIKTQEIEETVVDEKGKEKTVKKTIETVNSNEIGLYAKFFDNGNVNWTKDPELNLMFLRRQQDYANEKLQAKGYLFLNEVYEMLGLDKTRAGNVVGWIYDKKNPVGDNEVDFGIYDLYDDAKRRFVNGWERSILLDFNVDGNILDLVY